MKMTKSVIILSILFLNNSSLGKQDLQKQEIISGFNFKNTTHEKSKDISYEEVGKQVVQIKESLEKNHNQPFFSRMYKTFRTYTLIKSKVSKVAEVVGKTKSQGLGSMLLDLFKGNKAKRDLLCPDNLILSSRLHRYQIKNLRKIKEILIAQGVSTGTLDYLQKELILIAMNTKDAMKTKDLAKNTNVQLLQEVLRNTKASPLMLRYGTLPSQGMREKMHANMVKMIYATQGHAGKTTADDAFGLLLPLLPKGMKTVLEMVRLRSSGAFKKDFEQAHLGSHILKFMQGKESDFMFAWRLTKFAS